jgi:hypothetical protein
MNYKLDEKFASLSPKQKAFSEMVGVFVASLFGAGVVAVVAHFGYWMELSICLVLYCGFNLIKSLYELRVSHYERLDSLNKK